MHALALGESLDCQERPAGQGWRDERAALHCLAVEQNHAGAALAGVAAHVGAGEAELVAEQFRHQRLGRHRHGPGFAVEGESEVHETGPCWSGEQTGVVGLPSRQHHVADIEGIVEEETFGHVGHEFVGAGRVEHHLDEVALVFDAEHAA